MRAHRPVEADDSLDQKPGEDVECTFAAWCLVDHHRDEASCACLSQS